MTQHDTDGQLAMALTTPLLSVSTQFADHQQTTCTTRLPVPHVHQQLMGTLNTQKRSI